MLRFAHSLLARGKREATASGGEQVSAAGPVAELQRRAEAAISALGERGWVACALQGLPRPPRVLYVVLQFPQLSESHIYAEIACMRRLGVEVEVWAKSAGASPFEHDLVVHRGSMADAVARFDPDLMHAHWFTVVDENRAALAAADRPLTVRGHSFDPVPQLLESALALPNFRRGYLLPGSAFGDLPQDPRLCIVAPIFDSTLFRPTATKDRRLVLRASPGLTWNNLRFLIDLAPRLPRHRVVIAIADGTNQEAEIVALQAHKKEISSLAELRMNVQRPAISKLFGAAGIYVHSSTPSDGTVQKRIGGPVSVAEAMATGAFVVIRNVPAFADFVGEAGATYGDVDEAAAILRSTEEWSDAEWEMARWRSVERAFRHHADEIVLRPVFEDWCSIACERAGAAAGPGTRTRGC